MFLLTKSKFWTLSLFKKSWYSILFSCCYVATFAFASVQTSDTDTVHTALALWHKGAARLGEVSEDFNEAKKKHTYLESARRKTGRCNLLWRMSLRERSWPWDLCRHEQKQISWSEGRSRQEKGRLFDLFCPFGRVTQPDDPLRDHEKRPT